MKTLYIIRGVPGSGKSTFAKTLAASLHAPYFEADMYHIVDGVYQFDSKNLPAAHEWCRQSVELCMVDGNSSIIVSNTFCKEKDVKPYLDISKEYGYFVSSIVMENRMGTANVHNVPGDTLKRMEQNLRNSLSLSSNGNQ